MYSADPYIDDFKSPTNPLHPNLKGYAKIGEVVAAYLQAN
jgi:lysophospholipase L1-like esterase